MTFGCPGPATAGVKTFLTGTENFVIVSLWRCVRHGFSGWRSDQDEEAASLLSESVEAAPGGDGFPAAVCRLRPGSDASAQNCGEEFSRIFGKIELVFVKALW